MFCLVIVYLKLAEFNGMILKNLRNLIYFCRPDTSLGHLGGEEFSKRSPNFINYVQHIFPRGAKNFAGVRLPYAPLVTGLDFCIFNKLHKKVASDFEFSKGLEMWTCFYDFFIMVFLNRLPRKKLKNVILTKIHPPPFVIFLRLVLCHQRQAAEGAEDLEVLRKSFCFKT